MQVRVWRSDFDPLRAAEYEQFEKDSLQMWSKQPALNAVHFLRSGPNSAVTMTFWETRSVADAFLESTANKDATKKLEESGLLRGQQKAELLEFSAGTQPQRPAPIVRIWRSDFDLSLSKEYDRFEIASLHMWIRQRGFAGTAFLRSGPDSAVTMSWWESRKDVEALPDSPTFRDSIRKLEASEMLRGQRSVELLEVKGGFTARQPIPVNFVGGNQYTTEPYVLNRPGVEDIWF
jgi:heme-degrading monooxygenase HmoA